MIWCGKCTCPSQFIFYSKHLQILNVKKLQSPGILISILPGKAENGLKFSPNYNK